MNKPERALHHHYSGVKTPSTTRYRALNHLVLRGQAVFAPAAVGALSICWFCGFIDYDNGAAAMVMMVAGNGGGGEGEGGTGKEGFGSGEWIREGIDKATPASLYNMMTTKPAPHKAAASGLMPADKDEAMTTMPAPHKAAASGQMLANNEAMTKKPAPHKATASGQMPAY
jgi:hypothetical protein